MQTLTNKQAAYAAAFTAFKRHENWGWHLMSPFKEGASVEEATTIQEGIDTYHRLQVELAKAKRQLKNARYKANRQARRQAEASDSDSDSDSDSASAEAKSEPAPQPAPQPKPYHELVKDKWLAENANFYTALRKFRRFYAKDGKATFMVAKDGANYENLSMKVEELLVPGLRLWASILQVPYSSKLRRAELESVLQPVLATLARGPVPNRWIYL